MSFCQFKRQSNNVAFPSNIIKIHQELKKDELKITLSLGHPFISKKILFLTFG